jgi:hypothetical protein
MFKINTFGKLTVCSGGIHLGAENRGRRGHRLPFPQIRGDQALELKEKFIPGIETYSTYGHTWSIDNVMTYLGR